MPEVELLATGEGDYRLHDPDTLRAWMRDRERRDFVDKTTTAVEAVGRLVADGDYVSVDFSITREPLVLIREIVRRRGILWYRFHVEFTLMESTLLVAAGGVLEERCGYLDGTSEARERAGLPAGTRPWRVVTSKALFRFDEATHELTLLGVLEGLCVEAVTAEMGVKPRLGERVDKLAPPSAHELEILPDQIDPGHTVIGRTAKS